MGTDGGWIRLFRDSLNSQVFHSTVLWHVWSWCLLKAAWKPTWTSVPTGRGTTEVELQPGQFICGRKQAAISLDMNENTFRGALQKLEKIGNITRQPTSHYTLVSVCHWDEYQGDNPESHQASTRQPPGNHQATTRQTPLKEEGKEGKEREEGKEKRVAAADFTFPDWIQDGPEIRTAIAEWIQHRANRKPAYSDPAGQISKLLKSKEDGQIKFKDAATFIEAVDHSIASNYGGCFVPKGNSGNGKQNANLGPGQITQADLDAGW